MTITKSYTIVTLCLLVSPSFSIRCFDCGLYIAPDSPYPTPDGPTPGKIVPCTNMTIDNIKECKSSETSCMKYINKGLEVRLCSDRCIEDINPYTEREIHCCEDDACNGSQKQIASLSLTFLTILGAMAYLVE